MDKLIFRRACFEDPYRIDPDFREAWRQDTELEAFRRSVLKTDDQLRETLSVELPPGLAARLELKCLLDVRSPRTSKLTNWFRASLAIAASLVAIALASVLGINSSIFGGDAEPGLATPELANVVEPNVAEPMIQEVEAQPNAVDEFNIPFAHINFRLAHAAVNHSGHELSGDLSLTPEKVDEFARLLLDFQMPAIEVKFAERCPILKKRMLHALLEGEASDVTLVYVAEHLTELNSGLVVDGQFVYVQPIGPGTLILSSQSQADLDQHLSQITTSWQNEFAQLALAF